MTPEITMHAVYVPAECLCDEDEWRSKADKFIVTLTCDGKEFRCEYWQGIGNREKPRHQWHYPLPKLRGGLEDVLECLRLDADSGMLSHAEYCDELGADVDSIRARENWQACVKQYEKLRQWLGNHFTEFMKGGDE